MSFQMKPMNKAFLTEEEEPPFMQPNSSTKQRNVGTVERVSLDLASSTKMAFDLIIESGVGTKKDNNRRRKVRAYRQVYNPSKEEFHGQWCKDEEDSLEKLVGSKIASKPLIAPKESNSKVTHTETKFSQDTHHTEQPKKELLFTKRDRKPNTDNLSPPNPINSVGLNLEARPNEGQKRIGSTKAQL